ILCEGELFHQLGLEEKHFYETRHQKIFNAMRQVAKSEQSIDIVTVTTALERDIEQVGGTSYLLQLAEAIASTASFKEYEQLIINAYRLRKARKQALTFIEDPSEQGLYSLIENLRQYLHIGQSEQEKPVTDYLLQITEEMCFPKEKDDRVWTHLQAFDEMTGGLRPGELIIVAARPSVGKTAFSLQLIATHTKQGGISHFFSLEMDVKQLLQRMISQEASIHNQKFQHNVFAKEDYERAFYAIGRMSTWKLFMSDTIRSVQTIRASIHKIVHKYPEHLHLVVIDYLQLMQTTKTYNRRDLEIGEITRELKQLARDLDVAIVLISQLSRRVESRQNKRPMLSDLRESGNIEQDADMVMFLYRDDYYEYNSQNKSDVELILSKQRNGPVGTIELTFDKAYGTFTDRKQ